MNRTDDECYTGTGPAGEVVTQSRPTCAELLAQRDELAALLQRYVDLDEMGGIEGGASDSFYYESAAALSRIKGA